MSVDTCVHCGGSIIRWGSVPFCFKWLCDTCGDSHLDWKMNPHDKDNAVYFVGANRVSKINAMASEQYRWGQHD